MNYISPLRNYLSFAFAREFCNPRESDEPFIHQKGFLEKAGGILVSPFLRPCDGLLKNIKEPFMITAMTVSAMGLTTLFFYPEETVNALKVVFPFVSYIQPKVVKFAVFIGSEATLLGFGLRTYGRLSNAALVNAFESKTVVPLSLGTVIRKPDTE